MFKQGLLVAALAVSAAVPANAHAAEPAGSNWQHVEALPINTYIHINARTRRMPCTLKAIDADTLTCDRDTGVGTKQVVFQRTEITAIKIAHRGRSALIGAGIGGGAGALGGGIYSINNHYFAVRGAFAMIYGFAGLFAGAPLGYLTDFTASTIYRAP
jgi:hypothetical protein